MDYPKIDDTELLTPRQVADMLRLPATTPTRSVGFALARLGVSRIWVRSREWRVGRRVLESAIRRAAEFSE